MSRVVVINASYYGQKPCDRIYNLAVERIANYHRQRGDEVYAGRWEAMLRDYDKYYFSVIFSWDIPGMIQAVNMVRSWGKEVEIGGPAATFMHRYIEVHTGIKPHIGLDDRFERVLGEYDGDSIFQKMTFTSRGCPNGCRFCGVKRLEPNAIEYDDFPLASILADNNILATSWDHQRQVVNKYGNFDRVIDINSGFDVRFFQEKHYQLYSRLLLLQWRFAFDSLDVWADVWRVAKMMRDHGFDRHKVMFYVLIGFPGTVPEDAFFRLNSIIELGMNPYPMRYVPLNNLTHKYVAPGWTEDLLYRMTTYYQTPYLWRADTWENFRMGKNVVKTSPDQGELLIEGA